MIRLIILALASFCVELALGQNCPHTEIKAKVEKCKDDPKQKSQFASYTKALCSGSGAATLKAITEHMACVCPKGGAEDFINSAFVRAYTKDVCAHVASQAKGDKKAMEEKTFRHIHAMKQVFDAFGTNLILAMKPHKGGGGGGREEGGQGAPGPKGETRGTEEEGAGGEEGGKKGEGEKKGEKKGEKGGKEVAEGKGGKEQEQEGPPPPKKGGHKGGAEGKKGPGAKGEQAPAGGKGEQAEQAGGKEQR